MKTLTVSGNIDIKRTNKKLESISVVMPIWDKTTEDGFISVNIPLFNISTFAKNESDIDVSIKEAITLFCINAEKFGKGLEAELESLDWNLKNTEQDVSSMSFEISQRNRVFGQVMQTGEQFADKLEIAC
jgi:hypothetical protein